MQAIKLTLIILSMIFFSSCATQQSTNETLVKQESNQAVIEWLEALDAKDAEGIWQLSSKIITDRYEKDFLLKYWLGSRKPFGKIIEADAQLNWKYKNRRSSMPDGQYRRIVYWMKFENKTLSKNEFIVSFEENKWKVVQWSSY